MMALHPGTPAFARLSYAEELAGRVPSAETALRRALDTASTPADRAFAYYYLGELAFNNGRVHAALQRYRQGLQASPDDTASLAGRAKAEAALGRNDAAVADFTTVVNRVPQPQYVLEFGELLQSLGRDDEAKAQYAVFTDELRVFRANGVSTDLEPAQFYADHGDPSAAVHYARAGVRQRPFLEMQDALAWALHQAGNDQAALRVTHQAMRTGVRSALFHFHAGMIEKSLGMRVASRADLRTALAINPHFSPLRAPVARAALRELGGRA
jgi:tetratricopeptide (TPR) repeat protein